MHHLNAPRDGVSLTESATVLPTPLDPTALLRAEVERREQITRDLRESEERTRLLLENIPLPVIVLDSALRVRQCNPATGALAGADPASLVGLTPGDALRCLRRHEGGCGRGPFCDRCPLREAVCATLADGKPRRNVRVTLPMDAAAGSTEITLLASTGAVTVGGDRVVLLCLDEISGYVAAERAARESAAALQNVFDAAPIGVALVVDRTFRRVNGRFTELTGYPEADLLGENIRMLYPDDGEYRRVGEQLYLTARERGIGAVETVWRRRDGTIIDVMLQGSPLDPSDWAKGLTFTVTDVTELRRAAAERAAIQERLARSQKLEAIGTLAGGIAHDFNNILGAILGYTDFCLKSEALAPSVREDLEVVRQAGRRAADLVRQILTFSRQASDERVPVQPRHVAKEALKLLRASLPATIDVRARLDCDAVVLADPAQIHQILVNLCTNAALAMKGGGELEVTLDETRFDEADARVEGVDPQRFVRLSVRDTGCGMNPEVQARIFEPFFTTRAEGEGTGLGLSVVHGIVSASGGYITVRSTPGRGSIFDVYLPVATLEAVSGAGVAEERPTRGDERVLLVDDEQLLLDVLRRGLMRHGYAVTPFLDPRQAARAFEEAPDAWDVLVTDMTMPGVTGDELVRRARALRPDLPVVLCTGYSERMDPVVAASLGIDRFAYKPVGPSEVRRLVREAIAERRHPAPRLVAVGDGR